MRTLALSKVFCILCAFNLSVTEGNSQTIELTIPPGGVTTCLSIQQGTTVTFNRDGSCLQTIAFIEGRDPLFTTDDFIFTSAAASFTYTFNEVGEFSALCGIGPSSIPEFAACFAVIAPEPIPTLGEWTIIILLLMMLIVGVVYSQSSSMSASTSV